MGGQTTFTDSAPAEGNTPQSGNADGREKYKMCAGFNRGLEL